MKIKTLLEHVLQIGSEKVKSFASNKVMIKIALFVSIITYSGWTYFSKGFFYKGNALFILIISTYIYANEKKSFYKFVLFEFSIAWFIKELFFDPTVLTRAEVYMCILTPIIWFFKNGKFD